MLGSRHCHKQRGFSHTLRQLVTEGHVCEQLGGWHCVTHKWHDAPWQAVVAGQITWHTGWSHTILHFAPKSSLQRVSHFGCSHCGWHTSWHSGDSQFQKHCGVQRNAWEALAAVGATG